MGFRAISLFVVAVVCSLLLFFGWPTEAKRPDPLRPSFYSKMSDQQQREFLRERLVAIAETFNEQPQWLGNTNIERIERHVDEYVQRIRPDSTLGDSLDLRLVFGRGINYAPVINRAFLDRGISPVIGLYVAMIESDFNPQFNDRITVRAGLFGLPPEMFPTLDERFDVDKSAYRASVIAQNNRNKLGQSPSYLFVVMSYRTSVEDIARIQYEMGPYGDSTMAATRRGFDYVDKFLAAAIIGENPKSFLLDMKPLSSYPPASPPSNREQQIAELIAKLNGPERSSASDELIQLHSQDPRGVVKALIDAIVDSGPDAYRVNLYIARTLGSITDWEGSDFQLGRLRALSTTANYRDVTFKSWLDRAINNRSNPTIDCDCLNLDPVRMDIAQCRAAEASLRYMFSETGELQGTCDGSAQGPKATLPGVVSAVPAPQPSPSPIPSPYSSPSPRVSPTPVPRISVKLSVTAPFTETGQLVGFIGLFDGASFLCRFSFGDGSFSGWLTNCRSSHTYSSSGQYLAYVEVSRTAQGVDGMETLGTSPPVLVRVDDQAKVPNLVGRSEAEVRRMLTGFREFLLGQVSYSETSVAAAGTVISQSPKAGEPGANGTRIDIVIAKAAEDLVEVPNLIQMNPDQARDILTKYQLQWVLKGAGDGPGDFVAAQDPRPGSRVKRGTTVTLTVGYK